MYVSVAWTSLREQYNPIWRPIFRRSSFVPLLTMASRDRHSPVASLASLEFLQNQRRGSITDPSLHKINNTYRHHPDSHQDAASKKYMSDPRPTSPYVFGDATAHSVEPSSHLRKLLHSPSSEHISHRSTPPMSHDSQEPPRNHSGTPQIYLRTLDIIPVIGLNMPKESNHMNVDNDRHPFINRRGPAFDFNMRRHSIAVGANPINLPNLSSTLHGTKRKMSGDRSNFPPVGEDTDPQLVGPGVPSVMELDPDAPAPKRRGSTIDTQRIAQLSLNDRRNSVDSRGNQWLSLNDRRESAPSLFPPNVPGISSFNTGPNHPESQHSRAPSSLSSFSWPANPQVLETSNSDPVQNESPQNGRNFDPVHQTNLMPPINYPPDRRMSVPDKLTHPSSSRSLRSRSRPPSRQNTDPNSHSGPSSGQEEPSGASSPGMKHGKESGMTPYSRSPELRVSHKLAERKRRKEMKDLFDELRDQLPADRGMKASKWEILSKGFLFLSFFQSHAQCTTAIDFVVQLKRSHQELAQEVDILRQQVHGQQRSEAMPGFPPGGSHLHNGYGQIPPIMATFPPPLVQPHPPSQSQSGHQESRPNSTQSMFPPPHSSSQNVNGHRMDPHPT